MIAVVVIAAEPAAISILLAMRWTLPSRWPGPPGIRLAELVGRGMGL